MITKNKKNIIQIISTFFISNLLIATTFANVDVTASIESGTYNKVMKVELNTTESGAKTYYGFNPDGNPGDLELYTGAILIKKSTPLVFFSFLTTSNESKIKINEYTINYPNDIKIGTGVFFDNGNINDLSIINNGIDDIDISYWIIKNDSSNYYFPESSIIKAGGSYSVTSLNGTGTIALYSPDEVKKDSVEIIIPAPIIIDNSNSGEVIDGTQTNIRNENTSSDLTPKKSTPRPTKITQKTPTDISAETPVINSPNSETDTPVSTNLETPKPETNSSDNTPSPSTTSEPSSTTEPTTSTQDNNTTQNPTVNSGGGDNSFNDSIKNSIIESGNETGNAVYFILGLLAFSIIGGISLKIINTKKSGS